MTDEHQESQWEISIHAPREGGDGWIAGTAAGLGISIHAPREGGDNFPEKSCIFIDISIHAPREGGDLICFPQTANGL